MRHSFSAALTYDLPSSGLENKVAQADAPPLEPGHPVQREDSFSSDVEWERNCHPATGMVYLGNLNLVPGQPIYIYGSICAAVYNNGKACPGGRAINPNAFALPASGPPGDAPRNFARGFSASQMDFAVRREFPIHEGLKLQFRAETFNIFNHPSFGQIDAVFYRPDIRASSSHTEL